ncbi:MAG: hypothetical protein V9G19_20070 [Tetrasphaera sp.]
MDDVLELAGEIADLHRGRGLRRTSLPIGPRLRAALHLDISVGTVEARDRVVASMRASASTLPDDLQSIFLIASGLTASEPLLGDRLTRAGKEVDRDVRTVRRRLTEANTGVATVLARGSQRPVEMGSAWFIEEFDSLTDLRTHRPVLRGRKLVTPTLAGVSAVREQFLMPRSVDTGPEPTIRVTEGGELTRLDQQGRNSWTYDIALAEPTRVGIPQTIEVEVTVPSREWLMPRSFFTPYRPCRRMTSTTHFGTPPAAELAWQLRGVLQGQSWDDSPTGALIDPRENPDVVLEFESLQIGLSYGIAWRWVSAK